MLQCIFEPTSVQIVRDRSEHALAAALRGDVDVTVVRVAAEAMSALLQFLVQIVQHDVGQQWR